MALTPERLGAGTTIHFGLRIDTPDGQLPSPVTEIDLLYPTELGVATSGLGFATCRRAVLEADGPPGCPTNSRMGYGSAVVEVPFGPEIVREIARISLISGPVQHGHLGLLFYVNAESPVSAQLVFPGLVLPAQEPFGGDLHTNLPLVPTLPGIPDAAVVEFHTTLGPSHITYYEYTRHKTIAYHPEGILLPHTCPRGGFPFAVHLTFQDAGSATAHTIVPCPVAQARHVRIDRGRHEGRR